MLPCPGWVRWLRRLSWGGVPGHVVLHSGARGLYTCKLAVLVPAPTGGGCSSCRCCAGIDKTFISEVLGLVQCSLSCRGASFPGGGNCSGSCEKGGMPGCPLHLSLAERATFALLRLSLLVSPSVPGCLLAGHSFLHILAWLPRAGAALASPQSPAETTWGGFFLVPGWRETWFLTLQSFCRNPGDGGAGGLTAFQLLCVLCVSRECFFYYGQMKGEAGASS